MNSVSVIVPCLNAGPYIRGALDSILGQTRLPEEIIVADGGSTDGAVEVLESYRERVAWFRQEGKGVSRAKNQAIARAKGDYIAFLDADDLWYPEKLEIQFDFLNGHPEFGFCSSDVDFFNEEGTFIKGAIRAEKKPHSGYVFDDLFTNNFISSATIMLRRECFERAGLFDEEIFYAEDTDMWLRVAREFELGYISQSLAKYRVHPGARTQEFAKHYASLEKIYEKLNRLYPEYFHQNQTLIRSARFNLYRRWAYRHFAAGEYAASRRIYFKVLRQKPMDRSTWAHVVASFLPPAMIAKLRREK